MGETKLVDFGTACAEMSLFFNKDIGENICNKMTENTCLSDAFELKAELTKEGMRIPHYSMENGKCQQTAWTELNQNGDLFVAPGEFCKLLHPGKNVICLYGGSNVVSASLAKLFIAGTFGIEAVPDKKEIFNYIATEYSRKELIALLKQCEQSHYKQVFLGALLVKIELYPESMKNYFYGLLYANRDEETKSFFRSYVSDELALKLYKGLDRWDFALDIILSRNPSTDQLVDLYYGAYSLEQKAKILSTYPIGTMIPDKISSGILDAFAQDPIEYKDLVYLLRDKLTTDGQYKAMAKVKIESIEEIETYSNKLKDPTIKPNKKTSIWEQLVAENPYYEYLLPLITNKNVPEYVKLEIAKHLVAIKAPDYKIEEIKDVSQQIRDLFVGYLLSDEPNYSEYKYAILYSSDATIKQHAASYFYDKEDIDDAVVEQMMMMGVQ